MEVGHLKGWHVVVLLFAVLLVSVPLSSAVTSMLDAQAYAAPIGRNMPFVLAGIALLSIPALRRQSAARLAIPIPHDRRGEIVFAYGLMVLHAFAWMGAYVLWWHLVEGPIVLEQRLATSGTHVEALAKSVSVEGITVGIFAGGILAPIIEELVYRGILYPLWEQRFGWLASMLMTSTLFAVYHANFLSAFAGGIILNCLYRRTGSLRATIFVHALFNLTSVHMLLGQFIFPRDKVAPGDPSSWAPQIAALLVICVAVPTYVWLARNGREQSEGFASDHAAVPR
jgi:membrane protease YdiL (CAAX protease family)